VVKQANLAYRRLHHQVCLKSRLAIFSPDEFLGEFLVCFSFASIILCNSARVVEQTGYLSISDSHVKHIYLLIGLLTD